MSERSGLKKFLFPRFSRYYILRVAAVAIFAWLFFSYICIPIKIRGISMEPSYKDGSFNLIWRPLYFYRLPNVGDVVGVRLAGRSVMLLKRVVAREGDTVEFRKGKLMVNGKEINEPYLTYPCTWDLAPRKVEKGKVYVVGDNRNMPVRNHVFGQTDVDRIVGVALW
ncbi:MAG: signal peptidase I [Deltaproteobacteria bacterium]|nr:signal peptidase I [Deltaproteobacteria bacterium]